MLGKCFGLRYRLYLTERGKKYHERQIKVAHVKGYYTKRKHDCGIFKFGDVKIHAIPYLFNSYAYIIEKPQETQFAPKPVVLVDPGDFAVVQARLAQLNLKPTTILTTHKHWDHAGGNLDFLEKYPNLKIYGSEIDLPEGITHSIKDGDMIPFGRKLKFEAIFTGGHTKGHMMFKLVVEGQEIIISGDFLFQGFCGRHFESKHNVMSQALLDIKSGKISEDAVLFPGHNYGYKNLQFAATVDPYNVAIQNKLDQLNELAQERAAKQKEQQYSLNLCPLPLKMKDELEYNLALRVDHQYLQKKVGKDTASDAFRELWRMKDKFDKEQKRKKRKQN